MDFYKHRTVEQQAKRLPRAYQDSYRKSQLDRIEIDGCELQGYFEYSFMEEKSYKKQPIRSQDGIIVDLPDYSTFLTPRVIIKYNMMGIDDYRNLMTLLNSKNVFEVTCYDEVADKRVTHEMYFAPQAMPVIYQKYLSVMGIQDCSIELIGTNRPIDETEYRVNLDSGFGLGVAYFNDDWLHFLLRNDTVYEIRYSPILKQFIVSKDGGITAIYRFNENIEKVFVSPYEQIVQEGNVPDVEISYYSSIVQGN
jgi:hypothetical protein